MDVYTLCDPPSERLEQLRREGWVEAHPTGVHVVINGETVTTRYARLPVYNPVLAPTGWWTND